MNTQTIVTCDLPLCGNDTNKLNKVTVPLLDDGIRLIERYVSA